MFLIFSTICLTVSNYTTFYIILIFTIQEDHIGVIFEKWRIMTHYILKYQIHNNINNLKLWCELPPIAAICAMDGIWAYVMETGK